MNIRKKLLLAVAAIVCMGNNMSYSKNLCTIDHTNLIVLLKFDDVVASYGGDASSDTGISKKWNLVAEYFEANKISASFGIIGESLERENKPYFSWLRSRTSNGIIEFWNHGYKLKYVPDIAKGQVGEFNGSTSHEQYQALARTQKLALERFGTVLHGFGPHASAVDVQTFDQLDKFPEIKYIWFYKSVDDKKHSVFVIKRLVELEVPIFKPNYEAFLKSFNNRDKSFGYIALQGHPNEWDQSGFDSFVRVINFLQKENAIFCRPSDVSTFR